MTAPVRRTSKYHPPHGETEARAEDTRASQRDKRAEMVARRRFAPIADIALQRMEKEGVLGLLGSGRSEAGQLEVISEYSPDFRRGFWSPFSDSRPSTPSSNVYSDIEIVGKVKSFPELVADHIKKVVEDVFRDRDDVEFPVDIFMKTKEGYCVNVATAAIDSTQEKGYIVDIYFKDVEGRVRVEDLAVDEGIERKEIEYEVRYTKRPEIDKARKFETSIYIK
jgi:hypothetical protein